MSANSFVEDAAEKASWLVRREARGPGDIPGAMRRLESKYGIPYSVLWSLRYRKPRDILITTFVQIDAAYQAECDRQRKLLEHAIAVRKATTGIGAAIDRAVSRLAAKHGEALGE